MKRKTVRRDLKKKLAELKSFVKNEPFVSDIDQVYGSYNHDATQRALTNARKDIDDLEFLLKCLDIKEEINLHYFRIFESRE